MAIDFMAKGGSKEAFAASIGVSKMSLYRWIDKHKSFSDSLKKAETYCQKWWEDRGHQMLNDKNLRQPQVTMWIFNMKNRFGWADKQEIKTEKQDLGVVILPSVNRPKTKKAIKRLIKDNQDSVDRIMKRSDPVPLAN